MARGSGAAGDGFRCTTKAMPPRSRIDVANSARLACKVMANRQAPVYKSRAKNIQETPMLSRPARIVAAAALLLVPLAHAADGVGVRFDRFDPAATPFPTDRFTVRDWTQHTFRRVHLPKPDCTVRPSDCADIDVLNTLDGFSTQPRITVPFTGAIAPASVTSDTVFLVDLGDTPSLAGSGHKVGINQVVWDPATRTLAF